MMPEWVRQMARDARSRRAFSLARRNGRITGQREIDIWCAGYEAGLNRARREGLEPAVGLTELELRQALRDAAADSD